MIWQLLNPIITKACLDFNIEVLKASFSLVSSHYQVLTAARAALSSFRQVKTLASCSYSPNGLH